MGLRRSSGSVGACRSARCSVLALGLVLLGAAEAHAYCRTRTCQLTRDDNVPCPMDSLTGCYTEGAAVFWGSNCLSYAIQRDGSIEQGITAEQMAPIVEEGFRAWSDVLCANAGSPPITALSQGSIACAATEFNCQVPEENSNIIVFRDDFVDRDTFRAGVIALTTLTASIRTGQIFDADIEINSRDEEFVIGEPPPGSLARDLRGVLNHELGHLLGLSHSNARSALMNMDYRGTLLPTDDDIAGICAIRSGSSSDPECDVVELPPDAGCVGLDKSCRPPAASPPEEEESGCTCELPASGRNAPGGWVAGVLLACWLRRRR